VKYYGGSGDDTIVGTDLDDEIYGNGGDDLIIGGGGNDLLSGGDGNDTIHGGANDDTIYGGTGENWLYGDDGNDTIYSQPTDFGFGLWINPVDHIDGGSGIDTLYLQRDFAQYHWSSLYLNISDPTKTATLQDGTTITGIESLHFFGGDESDIVIGGIGNNVLNGGGGSDSLTGGPRDDVLDGGPGADTMYGGGGNDYFYSIGTDPDWIDGGDGIDTARIDRSSATMAYNFMLHSNSQTPQDIGDGTTLVRVESIDFTGGSGDDILGGGIYSEYGNTLHGGGGNDQLYDGFGNDYLDGGDQHDTIHSYYGFDTIDGGNGNDTLILNRMGSKQNLHLDLTDPSTPQTIGDGGTQQTPHGNILLGTSVVNIENVIFSGGSGNDVVTGGEFSDTLYGMAGNDTLCGGTQSAGMGNIDRLDGGPGNDTLIGGPGADYFMFDDVANNLPQSVDHVVNFTVASDRGVQADKILLNDVAFTDLDPNMSASAFYAHVHEAQTAIFFTMGTCSPISMAPRSCCIQTSKSITKE